MVLCKFRDIVPLKCSGRICHYQNTVTVLAVSSISCLLYLICTIAGLVFPSPFMSPINFYLWRFIVKLRVEGIGPSFIGRLWIIALGTWEFSICFYLCLVSYKAWVFLITLLHRHAPTCAMFSNAVCSSRHLRAPSILRLCSRKYKVKTALKWKCQASSFGQLMWWLGQITRSITTELISTDLSSPFKQQLFWQLNVEGYKNFGMAICSETLCLDILNMAGGLLSQFSSAGSWVA